MRKKKITRGIKRDCLQRYEWRTHHELSGVMNLYKELKIFSNKIMTLINQQDVNAFLDKIKDINENDALSDDLGREIVDEIKKILKTEEEDEQKNN